MTHDKVRQDFEATKSKHQCCRLKYDQNYAKAGDYYLEQTRTEFAGYCAGYQAGRAAERAENEVRIATLCIGDWTVKHYNNGVDEGYKKARAEIRKKLESEEVINDAARGIFDEYYPNGYGAVRSYDTSPKSQKANLRRNAKAAITRILEVI